MLGLERRGRLAAMTMIGDPPPEMADRVQARHEGDCIMGAGNSSAIGTLVETAEHLPAVPPHGAIR